MDLFKLHSDNPLTATPCPDPFAFGYRGEEYLIGTQYRGDLEPDARALPLHRRLTDGSYLYLGGALSLPERCTHGTAKWAPEVHRLAGGQLVMLVSIGPAAWPSSKDLWLARLVENRRERPVFMLDRKLVGTATDGTLYRAAGTTFLYWNTLRTDGHGGSRIVGASWSDDLFQIGKPVEILQRTETSCRTGYGFNEEGWFAFTHAGRHLAFASQGEWDCNQSEYQTVLLEAEHPLGPWHQLGGSILTGYGRLRGPGHASVGPVGGAPHVLFHAFVASEDGERKPFSLPLPELLACAG